LTTPVETTRETPRTMVRRDAAGWGGEEEVEEEEVEVEGDDVADDKELESEGLELAAATALEQLRHLEYPIGVRRDRRSLS
jgi:hypothetical protein